jgi:hypothetical protein
MSLAGRRNSLAVGTVTLGGTNFLADITNCTVTLATKTVEGKGIADRWGYAFAVGSEITIEGDFYADTGATTPLTYAYNGTALAFVFDTTTDVWSGSVQITNAQHIVNQDDVQKYRITASGWGAPTLA